MDIVFAPAAAQDIEEIGDYIYAENPAAAIRFIVGLRSRCSRIVDAPNGGAPRFSLWPGLRSVVFRPYIIFYTVHDDSVRIERVLHGARDVEAILGDD